MKPAGHVLNLGGSYISTIRGIPENTNLFYHPH
jgi:hypothetical protein